MQKKKALLSAFMTLIFLLLSVIPVSADTASNVRVSVDNQLVTGNVSPVYLNGTVLVPAKEFAASINGSFSYDSPTMTGTIRQGENEVKFRLDGNVAKFDGKYIQAPAPMKIINNRFMVPAEFTARELGAEVYMNTARNQLMVFMPVNGKLVYQVVSGDTLWIISQLFGTTVSTIKQLNSITSDMIYVGQQLAIKDFSSMSVILPAQTTGSATIRGGPGFSFSPVGYLPASANITVVGKSGDWFKTVTPKGNGYIYYSVVGINQDIGDTFGGSTYFSSEINVDTSADSVTYSSYTVQKGDYLWGVAQKFGILSYELANANNLSSDATLYPGQVIKIPVHAIPVKSTPGAQYGEVLDWFAEGQYIFPIGKVGKFTDVVTGKSFMAERTIGASHSDTETLTTQDTQTMKDIFGGSWTWSKRAFILEVDGRQIAVSVCGMPHAGVDGVPFLQNVDNRSGNFGSGPNYDSISGNGMDGHFDVFMLNSLRHVDNKIDPDDQYEVSVAGGLQ